MDFKMKIGNTKNQGFAKKSLDFWRPKNPKNNKDFLGLDAPRMINSCGSQSRQNANFAVQKIQTAPMRRTEKEFSRQLNNSCDTASWGVFK